MQAGTIERELAVTLGELEELLLSESVALEELDRGTIDAITDKKLTLFSRLEEITKRVRPELGDREHLERIKKLTFANQLLLVHARDTVRGVLELAMGTTILLPQPAYSVHPSAGGVRLNVKG